MDLLSIGDAARFIAEHTIVEQPIGAVGLEIEAHCFDLGDPRRRPDWEELTAIIAALPTLPGGSLVSVEPGGAVELSGPPAADVGAAIAAMQADRRVVSSEFGSHGMGLVLSGTDPLRPGRRVNPAPRYRAMEQFFAARGSATAGTAMMTSTAALQVNLNAGPRHQWAERIALAHALGPTMIAITANSPMLNGRFTGWISTRQRIWRELDALRCGPFYTGYGDPADQWAHYALTAPVMLVHTPQALGVTDRVPLADWIEGRTALGGRLPTTADIEYHLSTLFPPVRPKGWLEIRYLDSVPDALWPTVVFILTTLLDDPELAAIAATATEPVATAWDRAARIGLTDPALRRAALTCVTAAAHRAPPPLAESVLALADSITQGRSPADDFTDRIAQLGIRSAIIESARTESIDPLAPTGIS